MSTEPGAGITVGVLLFDGYEPLDVVGPVNVFGSVPGIKLVYISEHGGIVTSVTGTMAMQASHSYADALPAGSSGGGGGGSGQPLALTWLLVPGGIGVRQLVRHEPTLAFLRAWCAPGSGSGSGGAAGGGASSSGDGRAPASGLAVAMSVCTGSALLAAAGLLDGLAATSNKAVFDSFVAPLRPQVRWVRRARWVRDGAFLTSSGVSAGMDAAVALVKEVVGGGAAAAAAARIEYLPATEAGDDPFADPGYVPPV